MKLCFSISQGLSQMSIHTIDFIGEGSNSAVSLDSKISSSDLRKQKLGYFRLPKVLYYYDYV